MKKNEEKLSQSQIDDIYMNILQPRPNMLDVTLETEALKVIQYLLIAMSSKHMIKDRSNMHFIQANPQGFGVFIYLCRETLLSK